MRYVICKQNLGFLVGSLLLLDISPTLSSLSTVELASSASNSESILKDTESEGSTETLLQLGVESYQNEQWAQAISLWNEALAQAQEQLNAPQEMKLLRLLSKGYFSLGDYAQSIGHSESYLEVAQSLNNGERQSDALNSLVFLYAEVDDFQQLIATHQRRLELMREIEQPRAQINVLIDLGHAYQERYELDTAADFQQQALELAAANDYEDLQASAQVNLSTIYRDRGQYQVSIELLKQALKLRENIEDDEPEEGIIYGNLGNLYKDLGHYDIAIEYQERSFAIAEATEQRQRQALVLDNLGGTYLDRANSQNGDYGKSIEYFRQSLALSQEIGDRRAQADTLNNLGSVYHRQLQYETAKDYYEKGLAIAQEIGNRRLIAEALSDIGFVNEGLNNYPAALEHYDRGIALFQEINADRATARALNNRAHTLLVWAAQEKARGDKSSTANKLEQAEGSLEEAIVLLEKLWEQIDSDLDRVSLFDTQQMSYNLTQQVLIARSPTENAGKALQSSEQGRGRAFARVLADKFGHTLEPPTPENIQDLARSRQVTLVEYAIMPRDDVIHQGKHTGKAGQLYIWVVQPSGDIQFQSVDLASQDIDLEALVQGSRESIGARNRGLAIISTRQRTKNEQQLKDLYKILIEPVKQWLPEDPEQKVIFIPHRELFLVPFAALQDSSGDYLIEHHTPVTAPSIQLLDLTQKQQVALEGSNSLQSDNVLIVGNPKMPTYWNGEGFSQLSGLANAQLEANMIGRLFKSDPLVGAEATEREVVNRMGSAALIHLATHGLLEYRNENPTEPQEFPGAIALTATDPSSQTKQSSNLSNNPGLRSNNPEDGLLTATEISQLTLQAQLVVLSACDTGRGDLSGDGVLGLARSLITAGSPSVLVSLWSVPDAPTSELMQHFYRHWQTQKLDKAQALRQAMLDTQKTHPSPNDWAAFSLIGEFD